MQLTKLNSVLSKSLVAAAVATILTGTSSLVFAQEAARAKAPAIERNRPDEKKGTEVRASDDIKAESALAREAFKIDKNLAAIIFKNGQSIALGHGPGVEIKTSQGIARDENNLVEILRKAVSKGYSADLLKTADILELKSTGQTPYMRARFFTAVVSLLGNGKVEAGFSGEDVANLYMGKIQNDALDAGGKTNLIEIFELAEQKAINSRGQKTSRKAFEEALLEKKPDLTKAELAKAMQCGGFAPRVVTGS